MMNKLRHFLIFLILTNCGFKIVSNISNFNVIEINTNGDKKINYILKNKLLLNSNNKNPNLIKLNVNTKKIKDIKERNISNQITKYELKIDASVEYIVQVNNERKTFTSSKSGLFDVATRHSETLMNEKNLINLLIEDLSEDILDKLTNNLNDL